MIISQDEPWEAAVIADNNITDRKEVTGSTEEKQ
jgi:hypothetical protein